MKWQILFPILAGLSAGLTIYIELKAPLTGALLGFYIAGFLSLIARNEENIRLNISNVDRLINVVESAINSIDHIRQETNKMRAKKDA